MLEKLDMVNWSALEHAYGKAGDVPAMLRAALSNDKQTRENAFAGLFSNIYHQGKVYEASAYAVPFLYEMLESDETPDKSLVANLLALMADGHSYLEAHASFAFMKPIIEKQLAEKGTDWNTQLEKEKGWVKVTREAVGKKLNLLYDYINDKDTEVRTATIRAFTFYADRATETVPLLESAIGNESEEAVQEQIRIVIASLKV